VDILVLIIAQKMQEIIFGGVVLCISVFELSLGATPVMDLRQMNDGMSRGTAKFQNSVDIGSTDVVHHVDGDIEFFSWRLSPGLAAMSCTVGGTHLLWSYIYSPRVKFDLLFAVTRLALLSCCAVTDTMSIV
jgi:hypothetical protein